MSVPTPTPLSVNDIARIFDVPVEILTIGGPPIPWKERMDARRAYYSHRAAVISAHFDNLLPR